MLKNSGKLYFSNKGLNSNEIFLSVKGRLIKDPAAIVITETIGLKQFQIDLFRNLFEDHTKVIRIKSHLENVSNKFDFKKVHEKEVKRGIINLNSKKQHVTVLYQPKFLNNFAAHIFP